MRIFLVVDDSPVVRRVANRILNDIGFSVIEAEDGFEALEKSRRELPDAILVDWDLGSMGGLEFLDEYSQIPGANESKILYCTSEIVVPEMTKAKRMGADGFLMKPFNREIVVHKLAELGLIEGAPKAA